MNRDIMDIACVGGNGGFSIVDWAGLHACVWPAGIVVYYVRRYFYKLVGNLNALAKFG